MIAVAAGLLLAALAGLAVVSHFRDSPPAPMLPARVGNWYQARAAPLRAALEGTTTACGVELGRQTMGLADPVLPCGAKIYVGYGERGYTSKLKEKFPSTAKDALRK